MNNNLAYRTENGNPLWKVSIKFGYVMGLLFCGYTLLMWVTALDTTFLRYGRYLDMAIIILPITVILLALKRVRKHRNMKLAHRLLVAVGVGLVSYLIYHPFLHVYHEYINPDWYESVLVLKQEELASTGQSEAQIEKTLRTMRNQNISQSGLFAVAPFVASVYVVPVLIAFLSFLFIKSNRKTSCRAERP